jgi:hypothetical protein
MPTTQYKLRCPDCLESIPVWIDTATPSEANVLVRCLVQADHGCGWQGRVPVSTLRQDF